MPTRAMLLLTATHSGTHISGLEVIGGLVIIVLSGPLAWLGEYGFPVFRMAGVGFLGGYIIALASDLSNPTSVLVGAITAEGLIIAVLFLSIAASFLPLEPQRRARAQWPTDRERMRRRKFVERDRKAAERQQGRERKAADRQRKEEEKQKRRLGL